MKVPSLSKEQLYFLGFASVVVGGFYVWNRGVINLQGFRNFARSWDQALTGGALSRVAGNPNLLNYSPEGIQKDAQEVAKAVGLEGAGKTIQNQSINPETGEQSFFNIYGPAALQEDFVNVKKAFFGG